jgi:hypothetical protein
LRSGLNNPAGSIVVTMKATASSMRTGRKYTVRAKEWLVGGKFPGSDQVAVTTTVNVNVFAAGTVASKGWE